MPESIKESLREPGAGQASRSNQACARRRSLIISRHSAEPFHPSRDYFHAPPWSAAAPESNLPHHTDSSKYS
jgi:hypothetical protein